LAEERDRRKRGEDALRQKGGLPSVRVPWIAGVEEGEFYLAKDVSEAKAKDILAAVPGDLLKRLLAGILVYSRRIAYRYSENDSTGSRCSGTLIQERLHSLVRDDAGRDDAVETLEGALFRTILYELLSMQFGGLCDMRAGGNSRLQTSVKIPPASDATRSGRLSLGEALRSVIALFRQGGCIRHAQVLENHFGVEAGQLRLVSDFSGQTADRAVVDEWRPIIEAGL
jgi:hypothetical protein